VLEVHAGGLRHGPGPWELFHYDRFLAALVHEAPLCCMELPAHLAPPVLDHLTAQTPLLAWMLYGIPGFDLESGGGLAPEAWGYTHLVLHGHGCTVPTSPLESLGSTAPWRPGFEVEGQETQSAVETTEFPAWQDAVRLDTGLPVEPPTCDQVMAILTDRYGPPAARQPAGDGLLALWRLPWSPLLPMSDPILGQTRAPAQPLTVVRQVLRKH